MFFSADFVENRDSNNNPIPTSIGPTSEFAIEQFPTNYSFSLQVMIAKINIFQANVVTINFSKENDDNLLVSEVLNLPQSTEDEEASINFNLNFRNVRLAEEGIYVASLFVNGNLEKNCQVNMARVKVI